MKTEINNLVAEKNSIIPQELTTQELKEKVPTAFTKKAHPKMSKNYNFINTIEAVDILKNVGFIPFDGDQLKYRTENKDEGYQLHEISMLHPNLTVVDEETGKAELMFEAIITNSHNGYSKCSIYFCFYNVITNTSMLCISDDYLEQISSIEDIKNDNFSTIMFDRFFDIVRCIKTMKKTKLSRSKKIRTAGIMAAIRHNSETIEYDPKYLLKPLRKEDRKDDLWTTYCVVQEKLIKGYIFPKLDGEKLGRKIRAINHFEMLIKINKEMFNEIKIC